MPSPTRVMAQGQSSSYSITSPYRSTRPKSAAFSTSSPFGGSPPSPFGSSPLSCARQLPNGAILSVAALGGGGGSRYGRSESRHGTSTSSTFAPSFIKTEETMRSGETVNGIEGENDFSGKRYVWLKDPSVAFVKGWVVEELGDGQILVQCDDGSQRRVDSETVDKVNPAKFDKANDVAELTYLNEASVVHNLFVRYQADLIYTYSGLFLVTINPYCPLPIYTNEYINMYKGRGRDDTQPHIYAMADEAYRNLVEEGENQSILVTGESGAGKTENTRKVIQYLAAVAHPEAGPRHDSPMKKGQLLPSLSQQILRANPILEAFGNAQTVRNNNSSRFGKFIRIEFTASGSIAGAFIDWYLLEKSRVVRINSNERNYHIFYQLLKGADQRLKNEFLLDGLDTQDFAYTRDGHDTITGVSDRDGWQSLIEAFGIMEFSETEQRAILRTVAAVLHLGNISVIQESRATDQARLSPDGMAHVAKVCKLLGVPVEQFLRGLLHPRVKAGREWVEKVQTPEQVRLGIDALAKGIYERSFGDLVNRINRQLDRNAMGRDDSNFIGVLDIAGFEIFEENSLEQFCINYTNEKLQQFFNHHMFVLEQEEYAREKIEWQFIDFGRDLQPTIDLIELPNPIGVFSCLDEDCVMPKATDRSFTEKLHSLLDKKSAKYRPSRLGQGFILTHYAAEVEYSTTGWLEKNKDPLNDDVTRLLAASTEPHIASLFTDCAVVDDEGENSKTRVKKGLFRTVAQRHKEQLHTLMAQLNSTHPHFVRCILPNHKKRPKQFNKLLVLDQLRCNGVLEGIRIARTGFPNRLPFAEFRQRYEVLCRSMPKGYLEGQAAVRMMFGKLELDPAQFRVGLTKVFFRAGVLADLEERRDDFITDIMARFQAVARGHTQRRIAFKRLFRAEATRIVQRNLRVYLQLADNPWWQLVVKMKPLLGATRTGLEVKKRETIIKQLHEKIRGEAEIRQKLEEDRRNSQAEVVRIQHILESERSLVLDKEEIFKRLQSREAELEEKLAGALEDQDGLEAQLDDLLQARKKAEGEAERYCVQLEQAASLIARLEDDRKNAVTELSDLKSHLDQACHRRAELEVELRNAKAELRDMTLAREAAAADQTRLLQAQEDLQARIDAETVQLDDIRSALALHLSRADTYRARLETAERETIQARQAEETARSKAKEAERVHADAMAERAQKDALNSSAWAKDRAKIEATLADVVASRDAAVRMHTETQGKMESCAAQIRTLRATVEDSMAERDRLLDEKRSVQTRLDEATANLARSAAAVAAAAAIPVPRPAAYTDEEVRDLRTRLARQEDTAAVAVEKMRRAEALLSMSQADVVAERQLATQLQRDKARLEKALNEAQVKVVDLETKGYSTAIQDLTFLNNRVYELESELERRESEWSESYRAARDVDRIAKTLQGQIEHKDRQNSELQGDVTRMRDKVDKLLKAIMTELQASVGTHERQQDGGGGGGPDRDLRDDKNISLRLERELKGWTSTLKRDSWGGGRPATSASSATTAATVSEALASGPGRRRGSWRSSFTTNADSVGAAIEVPKRKSSLGRVPSFTKGFI